MIVILGASGYVGAAFCQFFEKKEIEYLPLSRQQVNYVDQEILFKTLKKVSASFLVNAAGMAGYPNIDACEDKKTECLQANAVLPGIVSQACSQRNIPWGHVSTSYIYAGRNSENQGFSEEDTPNFTLRQNVNSFYSGSKALGEEVILHDKNCYIWRMGPPFSHVDSPKNYISKLIRFEKLVDATNSLSYLEQFVAACYQCWQNRVDFGIYNLTNPGQISTKQIVQKIQEHGVSHKQFKFFIDEAEFLQTAVKSPRPQTLLNSSKAIQAGIQLDHIHDALDKVLTDWQH